jgi:hypothetical protein
MSSSQHPVALRLERQVGGATKLLATVMGLPLVDGIFPALVLAGGLDSTAGILQVGLLVFGGSATVAVILAEMDGTPREQAGTVLAVGTGIVALAALEAAFAPTIASALDLHIFERFAALVIGAIAAKTASARIGEYLPGPSVIVGLGLIASLQPAGFEVVMVPDYALVLRATAAAATGVGFALAVALTAPHLRRVVDIDRFRFGSAVALGVLPLSLLGFAPGRAPLAVLLVTAMLAYDPGATADADDETNAAGTETAATAAMTAETNAVGADAPTAQAEMADAQALATDGAGSDDDADSGFPAGGANGEREPWL